MSIFYSDPPSTPKKQEDISTPGAIALLLGLLAVIGSQKLPSAEALYFRFYKIIYFGGYSTCAFLAGVAIYQIVKHTKKLIDRAALLSQAKKTDDSIRVGETIDGVGLNLSEKVRCGHVQILGSTGRGKTESVIVPWICRDILRGRNAVLIDGKGDPDILEKILQTGNQRISCEIEVFDLGNPDLGCAINPLQNGSPQQITDRIFTAFEFHDPYYKSVQYDLCGSIVQLIHSLNDVVTFKKLYELLTNDEVLSEAIANCKSQEINQKVAKILAAPKQGRDEKLSGLLSQLSPFATGEVAPLVNGKTDLRECRNISDIVLKNDETQRVLAVLIPTLKYQQIGHQLGKLILQELGWAIGERASRCGKSAEFLPVFLDEFSAFVYPGFTNILNKARSSQVALHLSHQALSDLAIVSKEVAEVVVTNSNVKCILGLNDPNSADFIARHIGTSTEEKFTEQAEDVGHYFSKKEKTGRLSIREVEAYKIHPNLLKNFMNGRGVIHFPTPLGNISEEIQFEALVGEEIFQREVQDE